MKEFNAESKLFFKNQWKKNEAGIYLLPDEGSSEFLDLIKQEETKCVKGLNVNGVHIPGTLYYFLNHHYIDYDILNADNSIETIIDTGILRDNEWIIHTEYEKCKKEGVGLILFGGRQISKTTTLVCLTMHEANFKQNAEILALFSSNKDKDTFIKKLKISLQNNTKFLTIPVLDNDFNKELIRFGQKLPDNTTLEYSKLFIYLTLEGKNVRVGEGKALLHGSSVYYIDRQGVIEDCQVGDRIFGRDGKLTTIQGVYPQGYVVVYIVKLEDGRQVKCCKDHLWTTEELGTVSTEFLSTYNGVVTLPTVTITPELELLSDKLGIDLEQNQNMRIASVKSICSQGFATCIKVDNEDSLFLTNNFIPTHNTPTLYFLDEVSKAPFLKVNEGVLPAILSQIPGQIDKLKCAPLYLATGGEAEDATDARKLFTNPELYHCKAYDEDKTGYFMSGLHRSNLKVETTFGKYLAKQNIDLKNKELSDLVFYESDIEAGNAQLDKEEEEARKVSTELYTQRRTFFPRKKADMFASSGTSMFTHLYDEFERLYYYLTNDAPYVEKVDFKLIGNIVTGFNSIVKPSNKSVLTVFTENQLSMAETDTAACIVDKPRKALRTNLYAAGADVYNTVETGESASLGAWYIMQKETTDINNPFNNRIVAWYNGRTDIRAFTEGLASALLHYGASDGNIKLLHEAADDKTTQWFMDNHMGTYLEDSYTLSKEINPNTNARNAKGMRATLPNQRFYLQSVLDYCEEEMGDGRLGLWRIPDPYLVQQLMKFTGPLAKTDAIVAFGHALINANKDRRFGQVKMLAEEEKKEVVKPRVRNAFGYKARRSTF